jgi:hypothetical protein
MSVTAAEIITAARDGHAAFTKHRHPDAGLLRVLSRYKRQLWGRIANVNSSVLAVEDVIDIQTFDFTNGYAFPDHIYVLPDGEVSHPSDRNPSDRSKFTLIGQIVRLRSRPVLSGWFEGGQLFLQGELKDWGQAENLYISYVPQPTVLTAVTDNFDPAPDTIAPALETYLMHWMSKKGHNDESLPPIDRAEFREDWTTAEDRFLLELGERKKARRIATLDLFPGGR